MHERATPGWPTDKDGFRLRGMDMTRIETFTDAAFAFAVTLLVISTEQIPGSYQELVDALAGIPAFALSFLLIMTFWYGHWQWSRRFGLEDKTSIVLSGALVLAVLVYVYPLKFLFSLAMHWYSQGRLSPDAQVRSLDEMYNIFAIYGLGYAVMAAIVALLNWHALRVGLRLSLDSLEMAITRGDLGAWLWLSGVGAFSAALALFTPESPAVWPGWVYMLLPVIMPLYGRRVNRRIDRIRAQRGAQDQIASAQESSAST